MNEFGKGFLEIAPLALTLFFGLFGSLGLAVGGLLDAHARAEDRRPVGYWR